MFKSLFLVKALFPGQRLPGPPSQCFKVIAQPEVFIKKTRYLGEESLPVPVLLVLQLEPSSANQGRDKVVSGIRNF